MMRSTVGAALVLACVVIVTSSARPHAQEGLLRPHLDIDLLDIHERHRDRVTAAAEEAVTQLTLWLGPMPTTGLIVRGAARPEDTHHASGVTAVYLPWLSPAALMEIESAVTFAVAYQYWPHEPEAEFIARGLAEYLQARIVERLFNNAQRRPGHRSEGQRFFGGFVPWSHPSLRLGRASSGGAAFMSLERYLGWPAVQGALRVLAEDARLHPLTRQRTTEVLSTAVGQDLRWFFDAAFDPNVTIDYAIAHFTTTMSPEPCTLSGCYQTRVVVQRRGSATFTGSSNAVVGPYESGTGMRLQVTFDDRQQVVTPWDGRSSEQTFEFISPAPATAARLDPDGVLLLDATRLDHSHTLTSSTNVDTAKWISRWLVWLQDAIITMTALV